MSELSRKAFVALLGAAAAWPLAVRAQQQKISVVGFLGTGSAATQNAWFTAFAKRLNELGWIEGRTLTMEIRWAEGRPERYSEIGDEFVRRKVDIIVTTGGAVPALMRATSTIPIVFAIDGDPVGRGLVASLARPGGNVTGLSPMQVDLAGKRLELLREFLPDVRRLAVLANVTFPGAVQETAEVRAAAGKLGLEILPAEVRRAEDLAPAFEALKGRAEAVYVCGDALAVTHRVRINDLARGMGLPTIYSSREYVLAGGLLSYGPNFPDLFRRSAEYADRILRGARPADLPVEQPIEFDLIVNLKTAKAIGRPISETFLARADEVIE
jgi:putative tryptophan/tyrosine transport system substrate-binding protein